MPDTSVQLPEPDTSWVAGKWTLDDGTEIEVNTRLPYVAYGEFFAQGDDAETVIADIFYIWNTGNCSAQEAVMQWACNTL